MRILKAELRSWPDIKHSDTYHKTKENSNFFLWRDFQSFSTRRFYWLSVSFLKKNKNKTKQNYINQSEWRIFYYLLSCTNVQMECSKRKQILHVFKFGKLWLLIVINFFILVTCRITYFDVFPTTLSGIWISWK